MTISEFSILIAQTQEIAGDAEIAVYGWNDKETEHGLDLTMPNCLGANPYQISQLSALGWQPVSQRGVFFRHPF
jgi:hypothetical protein